MVSPGPVPLPRNPLNSVPSASVKHRVRHARESGRLLNWLRIQFRIMPEDPVHVEGQAPPGGEIGRDVRPLRYTVMKGHEAGYPGLEPRHHLRKGVAQPVDDLEYR